VKCPFKRGAVKPPGGAVLSRLHPASSSPHVPAVFVGQAVFPDGRGLSRNPEPLQVSFFTCSRIPREKRVTFVFNWNQSVIPEPYTKEDEDSLIYLAPLIFCH
jgi:hypothetical protein